MPQILALASKDLRLIVRDKAGFFFTFVLPVLFAIFFGVIFSGGGDDDDNRMKVAVVDLDRTDASRQFVAALRESDAVEATAFTDPAPDAQDQRPPRERALSGVRRGDYTAYIVVPEGFGASADRLFRGEGLTLIVGVDPSRKAEAGMLQGVLTQGAFEQLSKVFTDTSFLRKQVTSGLDDLRATAGPNVQGVLAPFLGSLSTLADGLDRLEAEEKADPEADAADGDNPFEGFNPVKIVSDDVQREWSGPANSFEVSFPQGIAWGLISGAFGFGLSLVLERVRGTLVRLSVAPLARWQVLAGKGVACFTLLALIVTGMLVLGAAAFGVRPDSIPLLALAIVSIGACWTGVMMLISVLGKSEAAVNGIGWAILMPMAMIGGGMVPLFIMPGWMSTLAVISPVYWSVRALEGALWRDFTPGEMLTCCAVLVGIGLAGFLVGSRVFNWSSDR